MSMTGSEMGARVGVLRGGVWFVGLWSKHTFTVQSSGVVSPITQQQGSRCAFPDRGLGLGLSPTITKYHNKTCLSSCSPRGDNFDRSQPTQKNVLTHSLEGLVEVDARNRAEKKFGACGAVNMKGELRGGDLCTRQIPTELEN
jgi:hypothetical protein